MLNILPLLFAVLAPVPTPTPNVPVYSGNPAVRMAVDARPLGFDADGNARWLVVSKFFDAGGKPTEILANSNLDWVSPHASFVQWQTRIRYGQPAAIVRTRRNGPLSLLVRATQPKLPSVRVTTNTRYWSGPRVVAAALGPDMVQIGWFPRAHRPVRVVRVDGRNVRKTVAVLHGPSSTYRDTSVLPGRHYRYLVYRSGRPPVTLPVVTTPAAPPATKIANAGGKGMWLFFSTSPLDDNYVGKMDPKAIVAQAVHAGLHYVELRTAYGAYWQVTPQAKPAIDAIIDGLAAHGIGTIGWTVPRAITFEDLAASVRTAYYRTPNGTPLAGLAVDLERGDEFLGDDPHGLPALGTYMKRLREALGRKYLLVATVEDPYLEHLRSAKYPYRTIARYSSVLQPMSYWRMMRRKPTTPAEVKILLRGSYDTLLRDAGRKIPISIGGQTTAEGRNGNPPADEITASLQISQELGAIGECFFDWDGTQPYQWDALANYRW